MVFLFQVAQLSAPAEKESEDSILKKSWNVVKVMLAKSEFSEGSVVAGILGLNLTRKEGEIQVRPKKWFGETKIPTERVGKGLYVAAAANITLEMIMPAINQLCKAAGVSPDEIEIIQLPVLGSVSVADVASGGGATIAGLSAAIWWEKPLGGKNTQIATFLFDKGKTGAWTPEQEASVSKALSKEIDFLGENTKKLGGGIRTGTGKRVEALMAENGEVRKLVQGALDDARGVIECETIVMADNSTVDNKEVNRNARFGEIERTLLKDIEKELKKTGLFTEKEIADCVGKMGNRFKQSMVNAAQQARVVSGRIGSYEQAGPLKGEALEAFDTQKEVVLTKFEDIIKRAERTQLSANLESNLGLILNEVQNDKTLWGKKPEDVSKKIYEKLESTFGVKKRDLPAEAQSAIDNVSTKISETTTKSIKSGFKFKNATWLHVVMAAGVVNLAWDWLLPRIIYGKGHDTPKKAEVVPEEDYSQRPKPKKAEVVPEEDKATPEQVTAMSGALTAAGVTQAGPIAEALGKAGVTSVEGYAVQTLPAKGIKLTGGKGTVVDGGETQITEPTMFHFTASYKTTPASDGGVRRAVLFAIEAVESSSPDIFGTLNFLNRSPLNIHFQSGCSRGGNTPGSVTLKMAGDYNASPGMAVEPGETVEGVVLLDPANNKFVAVVAKPDGITRTQAGTTATTTGYYGGGEVCGGKSSNAITVDIK